MSLEKDITQIMETSQKYLGEAWRDHPDPSGFMQASHDQKNALLVWWYNPFTGEFRKTTSPSGGHRDDSVLLNSEDLPSWIRGRVFKFNDTVYLLLYVFGAKILEGDWIKDMFDLASRSISEPITDIINDNGDDLSYLFEGWKGYKLI